MSTDTPSKAEFHDALARVFAKVKRASKDRNNPAFKSRYATLAAVCDACEDALNEQEFAYPQEAHTVISESAVECVVETVLLWKGHEYRSGKVTIPLARNATAQQIGSAFTYARRYSLSATLAVCPDDDDDDGNAASKAPRGHDRKPEPEEDPRWTRLDRETDALAKRRGIPLGNAQALVGEAAGLTERATDRDLPALMDAVARLLREPEPPTATEPAAKPAKVTKEQALVAANAAFRAAYKAYAEEAKAQGVRPLTWQQLAAAAIGAEEWSTEKGSHTVDDWMRALQEAERATRELAGASQ
jgi:hypothetical protein